LIVFDGRGLRIGFSNTGEILSPFFELKRGSREKKNRSLRRGAIRYMPKRHQQRRAKESAGRNNPKKSTVITTGPYKKPETAREQAFEHKDPYKVAQEAKVPPRWDPSEGRTHEADSQAMMEEGERRIGSDSNANKPRKKDRLHEPAERQPQPKPDQEEQNFEYEYDLRPDNLAGEDHGPREKAIDYRLTAYDVKDLYGKLADLTDDELKSILILPVGSRLEQGAKYIDLQHLEQGEVVATADMVADEDHYYVPKKETDYILWNRLNQVDNPVRLDESGPTTA